MDVGLTVHSVPRFLFAGVWFHPGSMYQAHTKLLQQLISDDYRVHMQLDNLPVAIQGDRCVCLCVCVGVFVFCPLLFLLRSLCKLEYKLQYHREESNLTLLLSNEANF